MAATVTWDGTFEADPGDLDEAKYGAGEIRELKLAISEREEEEHNFKAGTQPFHKGGKCSVVFSGTTTEINALTGMGGDTANLTLAWDETLKVLKYYNGSAWAIFDIDHGQLSGLTDDDHTQYLNLTKESQELEENLAVTAEVTIDGRDISVDGAKLDGIYNPSLTSVHATIEEQDVSDGTTKIALTEVNDNNSELSANTFTAKTTGYYIIAASALIVPLSSGTTWVYNANFYIAIYKNSVAYIKSGEYITAGGPKEAYGSVTGLVYLTVGQTLSLYIYKYREGATISSGHFSIKG